MNLAMILWKCISAYKFGNDLALVQQGYKNPFQAGLETHANEQAKKYFYNLINYNYR